MKNQADYSQYECPFSHIEKECGHELHGPEGYENTYGVWCACGFRGPVFCLNPEELKLKKIAAQESEEAAKREGVDAVVNPQHTKYAICKCCGNEKVSLVQGDVCEPCYLANSPNGILL